MRMGFREFGVGKEDCWLMYQEEAALETWGYMKQHGVFREDALNL